MLHDPVIVHIFGPFLKKWKYLHKFSMCKDYDPPTVYQNAFKMEEEGHSLCTLKKKPKVGTDQGWCASTPTKEVPECLLVVCQFEKQSYNIFTLTQRLFLVNT